MKNLIRCLILAVAATAVQASEDYYVWVDENGVTNYSEQSPQGVDAKHITTSRRFGERLQPEAQEPRSRGSRPGAAPAEDAAAKAAADTDKLADEERARILAKIAQTKRDNCEIGKKNLANLQIFARIRVKGADGKERVLSDEEKAQRMEQAKQTIKDNCSGG